MACPDRSIGTSSICVPIHRSAANGIRNFTDAASHSQYPNMRAVTSEREGEQGNARREHRRLPHMIRDELSHECT